MLITYKWLKDYVDFDLSIDELSEKMTMLGLEVIGLTPVGISRENEKNIHLGKVLDIKKHPKADRLKMCKIHIKGGHHTVITNSKNIDKGQHVVLALPGTVLPNGVKVSEATIKGEKSDGMLIPKEFLNLEANSEDIWILDEDEKAAKEVFEVYAEDDCVMEIDLTANRSDCLSVIGAAREVAAMLNKELTVPKPVLEETLDEEPNIQIVERGLCPRYSSRIIRGITVAESPEWIKKRLELCGIRSINNIVDATNYVMLEYGQPTHAFDLNRLEGEKIIVRKPKAGETLTTLDGEEREIDENMLVIADDKKPVALAGVMGGENSEILDNTRNLLLESAFFDPISIRTTSKNIDISTESSYRFERTADWGITPTALDRIAELILLSSSGHVSRQSDLYINMIKDKVVSINADFVAGKLGIEITMPELEDYLKRLGFTIMVKREDSLEVKIPTFRSDIYRPIDLVEEIARVYGYNNIPEKLFRPQVDVTGMLKEKDIKFVIRELVKGIGFTESYNLTFTNEEELKTFRVFDKKVVALGNPLTNDASHLRNRLFPGVVKNIAYNNKTAYRSELKYYEWGRTFHMKGKDFVEKEKLALAVSGAGNDYYTLLAAIELLLNKLGLKQFDMKRAKLDFLHPMNSALIYYKKKELGYIGELHPEISEAIGLKHTVFIAELDKEILESIYKKPLTIEGISKFPPTRRDISLVVDDEIQAREIMNRINGFHNLISEVEFTDIFKGESVGADKKSVTYSLSFQHNDRTLNDLEVNNVMDQLVDSLKEKFKAELR